MRLVAAVILGGGLDVENNLLSIVDLPVVVVVVLEELVSVDVVLLVVVVVVAALAFLLHRTF